MIDSIATAIFIFAIPDEVEIRNVVKANVEIQRRRQASAGMPGLALAHTVFFAACIAGKVRAVFAVTREPSHRSVGSRALARCINARPVPALRALRARSGGALDLQARRGVCREYRVRPGDRRPQHPKT